jgi:hypothetical protein
MPLGKKRLKEMDADFCRKLSTLLASTYIIMFPTVEVYSGSDVFRAKCNR